MKFGENDHDKDQDRHAWRAYMQAAIERQDMRMIAVPDAIALAAVVADSALVEERKRR